MKNKRSFLMFLIATLLSVIGIGCAVVPSGQLRNPQAQLILFPSHGTSLRPRTFYYSYPVAVPFGAWGVSPQCEKYADIATYGEDVEGNIYACERGIADRRVDMIIQKDEDDRRQRRTIYQNVRGKRGGSYNRY